MSELARRLIADNRRTEANSLDLGSCGLTEVPAEIARLIWLESLSLGDKRVQWDGRKMVQGSTRNTGDSNRNLRDLSRVARLPRLRRLSVSGTKVSDLSPLRGLLAMQQIDLSSTPTTDLSALRYLSDLRMVDCASSRVAELSPLSCLSKLEALACFDTKVKDLSPLARLFALRCLYLSETLISDLTPLAELSALWYLNCRKTEVRDLAPIKGLSALRTLIISDTKVTDLSPLIEHVRRGLQVKWGRSGEDGIYVEGCPLTNPPPEIAKQGNEAILNYFSEREVGGVDHLYEAKMLILGEGGAGKTSLMRRLYQRDKPLPKESETTRGIEIHRHEFTLKNGRRFRLNVWDFGGQEIYHATHQFFLTHRSLYVLVDDTRKDYMRASDEGFRYWLELIDVFGGHSPTLIFQNEKDGRSKAIDIGGVKQCYDNVKDVYKGDLNNPLAADNVRDGIEYFASRLSHIGEELPARWIKVRTDIEARAKEVPYVPVHEYFDIYMRHMKFDRTKALHLSQYLHDLGVFLHFQDDPLLARTIILQNTWATEAVYRILDDEVVKGKRGRFNFEDCQRFWPDKCYRDMYLELLALMQRFELCYESRGSPPRTWLVPQLLPPAKPDGLKSWAKPEDLVLRYRYDFLPKGMLNRLTVRQHRFVRDPERAWVTGVLFERDNTQVLVEVLPNGAEIELRARGPEAKGLISVVAADLDASNDSLEGLRGKVDKRVPCNCKACLVAAMPEFFDQKELLRRKEHGKLRVECRYSFEDVDVLELLDGIKMQKLPVWANEAAPEQSLRKVRIFLASSSELWRDRDEFERYFREQNDSLVDHGVYLAIVRWENSLDAMSETRLQDEYNKALRECDVFVSLCFTKTGKFTEEEFDVAHGQFVTTKRPLIYTYFKDSAIMIGSARKEDLNSLWAFQEKLNKLGHHYTRYNNIDDLKVQFSRQVDKILDKLQGM